MGSVYGVGVWGRWLLVLFLKKSIDTVDARADRAEERETTCDCEVDSKVVPCVDGVAEAEVGGLFGPELPVEESLKGEDGCECACDVCGLEAEHEGEGKEELEDLWPEGGVAVALCSPVDVVPVVDLCDSKARELLDADPYEEGAHEEA